MRATATEQINDLDEEANEAGQEKLNLEEALPDDFVSCNVCSKNLTADEKIINARFVNEAMQDMNDVSVFPICIKCNFE